MLFQRSVHSADVWRAGASCTRCKRQSTKTEHETVEKHSRKWVSHSDGCHMLLASDMILGTVRMFLVASRVLVFATYFAAVSMPSVFLYCWLDSRKGIWHVLLVVLWLKLGAIFLHTFRVVVVKCFHLCRLLLQNLRWLDIPVPVLAYPACGNWLLYECNLP